MEERYCHICFKNQTVIAKMKREENKAEKETENMLETYKEEKEERKRKERRREKKKRSTILFPFL